MQGVIEIQWRDSLVIEIGTFDADLYGVNIWCLSWWISLQRIEQFRKGLWRKYQQYHWATESDRCASGRITYEEGE